MTCIQRIFQFFLHNKTGNYIEAWRLPRDNDDTTDGYVSIAITGDALEGWSIFSRIDNIFERLSEKVEDYW